MWQAGCAGVARVRPRRRLRRAPSRALRPGSDDVRGHMDKGTAEPMSAIRQATSKSLMLFTGRAYPELAEEIGGHLGVSLTPTAAYEFANGELFVRFEESVRGCDAFVVQSHTAPINTWLMEQLIMV